MATAAKVAQTGESGENLEQVKQRFAQWRTERKRGEHVTDAMWLAAVGLVERHGLQRIARELDVNYDRLKRRFERGAVAGSIRNGGDVQFVEMFVPPTSTGASAPAPACIVEMQNARGGTMRVELQNLDGLADLAGAFWSAR